jgi:thiamine pyrophosphate-dependent acetolactate synthase large subunit-like protein
VLAVCGDGGFMMNSQEMETAVRLHLNLVVLVLQDNAYGMIRGQGRQGDLSARTSLSTPPIARIWVLLIDAKHHRLSGALRQALEPKPFSAT